jgi:ribosomal protein S18 acetylase RimI-like enzyme
MNTNPLKNDCIRISDTLQLRPISIEDQKELYALMKRIYPPAYIDYWKDNGNWYVNSLYTFENVQKELSEENTRYYFVLLDNKIIGILRIVYEVDMYHNNDKSFVKLHRLYLDQNIQNRGVGKQLMHWLLNKVQQEGYPKIWLDAMEMQPQALHFYKKLGFEIVDKVSLDFPLLIDEYRGMFKMVKILHEGLLVNNQK